MDLLERMKNLWVSDTTPVWPPEVTYHQLVSTLAYFKH